jgi:hypothetical protein
MSETTDTKTFGEQDFSEDEGGDLPPLVRTKEIQPDDELRVEAVDEEPEHQPNAEYEGTYRLHVEVIGGSTDVIRDTDRRPLVEGEEYGIRTTAKSLWRGVQDLLEEHGSLEGVEFVIGREEDSPRYTVTEVSE